MGNGKYDVFISYSSIDQKYADAVCHKIEDIGIRCFIAHRDIRGGEDWAKSITYAIQNTKVFVLLFSENSGRSNQVYNEVTMATKVKSVIIPFKLDDVDVEKCEYGFSYNLIACHWIDAMPLNNEALGKLVEQVRVNVNMSSNKKNSSVDDEFFNNMLKEFSKDERKTVNTVKASDDKSKDVKEVDMAILKELGLSSVEDLEEMKNLVKEKKQMQANNGRKEITVKVNENLVKNSIFGKRFSKYEDTYEIIEKYKSYEVVKESDKAYDVIEFGYYPQSEVKGYELTDDIINASYNREGDALVDGQVYRRLNKNDATYSTDNDKNHYDWKDRECLYFKYEPIRWRVLSREGNELFLLAESAIDDRRYNKFFSNVTWETCDLREWLNTSFIQNAFNTVERDMIVNSMNTNPSNECEIFEKKKCRTYGGNDTVDKVFLLSIDEVENEQYGFTDNDSRAAKSTDFAKAMGAYIDEKSGGSWWWLRSPGEGSSNAAFVYSRGWVYRAGDGVGDISDSIRPALKINL